MGLLDTLDRLDDRVLGRLPRTRRWKERGDRERAVAELACRAVAFLRDHPIIFGILLGLDLLAIAITAISLATTHTASQITVRGGRLAVGISSGAILLFLRQRRPRRSLDAASAGVLFQVLEGLVLAIVKGNPSLAGLALITLLFLGGAISVRRFLPHRCSEKPSSGVADA